MILKTPGLAIYPKEKLVSLLKYFKIVPKVKRLLNVETFL